MAQSDERLTLDFSSGRDPKVMGSKPTLGPCWVWSLLGGLTLSPAHSLCEIKKKIHFSEWPLCENENVTHVPVMSLQKYF